MNDTQPTLKEWSRLYDLAREFNRMAPWEWMLETDIFGLQDPESDAMAYVSIMGAEGVHFGIAAYLGAEGFDGFLKMLSGYAEPQDLFDVPQLMVSFEDREMLTARERAVIKELGIRFRGRRQWPVFRSFTPGWEPWYLEGREVRLLSHVMDQTLVMARRCRRDPGLLNTLGDEKIVVRRPDKKGDNLVWTEEKTSFPEPTRIELHISVDLEVMDELSRVPQVPHDYEIDFFLVPVGIGKRGTRRHHAYALMLVDGTTGVILDVEILGPEPSYYGMWGSLPEKVASKIVKHQAMPAQILVSKPLLHYPLSLVFESFNTEVVLVDELPALEDVKDEIFKVFMG